MASILTNTTSMAALHTLRSINNRLGEVQNEVSTGYRVAVAADNAAYWSISTTMRSDELALSAVQDALGLGAATVDTAYAGMESAINVLQTFQSKLVAAKEGSVDRSKIQTELEQLKDQIVSISESASFNGVNWLNTSIENIFDDAQSLQQLASSFVRSESDGVSVKTMGVDLSRTSLFNSTGNGLLQADDRSPGTVGGIRNTGYSFDPIGRQARVDYIFDGPLTFTDNSTSIAFTLTLDADDPVTTTGALGGTARTYIIDRDTIDAVNPAWNGIVSNRSQWREVLYSVTGGSVTIFQDVDNPAKFSVESNELLGRGSSYEMSNVTSTLAGGRTGGFQDTPVVYGTRAYTYSIWDGDFELKPDVEAYISITENHVEKTLTLTRDTVMAALGTTTGEVNSISDYIQVLNYAFADNGMWIEATDLGSSLIRYDLIETLSPTAGRKTSLGVTGATDNIGNVPEFGLLDIDVTGSYSLDRYIDGVQTMLTKVISGASMLGAIQTRIDLQEQFASKLSDSINTGIGRLVDANMNEASTMLKALQTQQQLGVQALQIANTSPSHIMQLFQ
ncbi:flagellin N-terminal helical domain-containing protein [Agrobacterium tumefaciens]|uniref:flagellin N-terminal helical domain-containing protein n=1 Tax=Agrobacterium tumefaciens TaxID=358 RepID=UPI0004598516|nr:flagellin [Agrobacterium tumefaciens]CDN96480.1 Flagellin domain protein [Agrobacterium tumefaciens]